MARSSFADRSIAPQKSKECRSRPERWPEQQSRRTLVNARHKLRWRFLRTSTPCARPLTTPHQKKFLTSTKSLKYTVRSLRERPTHTLPERSGSCRTGSAAMTTTLVASDFVPPPPEEVGELLNDLCRFLRARSLGTSGPGGHRTCAVRNHPPFRRWKRSNRTSTRSSHTSEARTRALLRATDKCCTSQQPRAIHSWLDGVFARVDWRPGLRCSPLLPRIAANLAREDSDEVDPFITIGESSFVCPRTFDPMQRLGHLSTNFLPNPSLPCPSPSVSLTGRSQR